MNGDPKLYQLFNQLNIDFQYIEHPEAPTIEIAKQYWEGHDAKHCKNLFFRNHKGNKHYLVLLDCDATLDIHALEQILKQGKLSFASPQRLDKYLGIKPGSVTPFALINDTEKHVHVFIDSKLKEAEKVSFHPCINTASLIIETKNLIKFIEHQGNTYQWINLY